MVHRGTRGKRVSVDGVEWGVVAVGSEEGRGSAFEEGKDWGRRDLVDRAERGVLATGCEGWRGEHGQGGGSSLRAG